MNDPSSLLADWEQELVEARHAIAQKDRLLHRIAHELREPVAILLLWETILQSAPDDELRRQALDAIRRSAQAQELLIASMLELARVQDGTLELSRAPVAIDDVIADALARMAPRIDTKKLRVEHAVAERRDMVSADPVRLRQILSIVVSRVVDCAEPGDRLVVAVHRDGASVTVDVTAGEPSLATDPLQEDDGSHGIQVLLARELVIAHGGTLSAGAIGKTPGARFRLSLRCSRPIK